MSSSRRLRRRPERLDRYEYGPTRQPRPFALLGRAAPHIIRTIRHVGPWAVSAGVIAVTGDRRVRRSALRAALAATLADAATALLVKPVVNRFGPSSSTHCSPSQRMAIATGFAGGIMADTPSPLPAAVGTLVGGIAVHRVRNSALLPAGVAGGLLVGAGTALLMRRLLPPLPGQGSGPHTSPAPAVDVHEDGIGVTAVVNPNAGAGTSPLHPGQDMASRIRDLLPQAEVIPLGPEDDLPSVLDGAAARCDVLAVAGGDGSVNAGAAAAMRYDRPLLVLPGGTLNNFATTLGVTSLESAVLAYRQGSLGAVDVGRVGDWIFLNTASFGAYPKVFDHRERLRPRLGKWPAFAVGAWSALREADPIEIVLNGRRTRVWWAFVGNCRHRTRALIPARRERLDDGLLDIRVLKAGRWFSRFRVVPDVLLAHWGLRSGYTVWRAPGCTVSSPDQPLRVACDGETFTAHSEIGFTKIPGGLRVFHAPAAEATPARSPRLQPREGVGRKNPGR
ncbi:MAG: diacylglycerol kinase family protein [Nocardiopsaceae bacterium]|nr:diacylglycerol kinase family protein [Nocardiopsaceae bacterium]